MEFAICPSDHDFIFSRSDGMNDPFLLRSAFASFRLNGFPQRDDTTVSPEAIGRDPARRAARARRVRARGGLLPGPAGRGSRVLRLGLGSGAASIWPGRHSRVVSLGKVQTDSITPTTKLAHPFYCLRKGVVSDSRLLFQFRRRLVAPDDFGGLRAAGGFQPALRREVHGFGRAGINRTCFRTGLAMCEGRHWRRWNKR